MSAWAKRLPGLIIPWREIGRLFKGGLLTPKDYSSYFKNILHRALLTRSRCPADDGATCCRCCLGTTEHLAHLAECRTLLPLWNDLAKLGGLKCTPRLVLLGIQGKEVMPLGLAALWLIVWKFVIISFTQLGVEGTQLCVEDIWSQAVRRLVGRVHSALHTYRLSLTAAAGKGAPAPAPEALNKLLRPLGTVSQTGVLEWASKFKAHLDRAGVAALDGLCTHSSSATALAPAAPRHVAFVASTMDQVPHCAAHAARSCSARPSAPQLVPSAAQCCRPMLPSSGLAQRRSPTSAEVISDPLDEEREMLAEWEAENLPPIP